MIPAIILEKLATEEGIAELEAGLAPASPILANSKVYRGGITNKHPDIREDSVVTVSSANGNLVIRLEIPSKEGGSSTTVIETRIPTTEFMAIQTKMNEAMFHTYPEQEEETHE